MTLDSSPGPALLACLSLAILSLGCSSEPPPVEPEPDAGPVSRPYLHAHNDYEHPRPLLDALEQRFESVEVDVFFRDGDIQVGHTASELKGTLRALYLEPLEARAQERGGFIHVQGAPFFLWIDLKEDSADLRNALADQLGSRASFTRFTDSGSDPRAVTVILTGNASAKEALVALAEPRPFIRDSNAYGADDPAGDTRWGYYAIDYLFKVNWAGTGEMPAAERKRFRSYVDGAHGRGRKLRFYATPETPAFWREAVDSGVDFLGTDELAELRAFIDTL